VRCETVTGTQFGNFSPPTKIRMRLRPLFFEYLRRELFHESAKPFFRLRDLLGRLKQTKTPPQCHVDVQAQSIF